MKFKRVVEIDVFEGKRIAAEGEAAYYLNQGDTHPWNGILPAGRIRLRLRIRVAFVEDHLSRIRVNSVSDSDLQGTSSKAR
jgi:hypothetical protein